jgi:drug/metabolite transporter (DMT)-like permease
MQRGVAYGVMAGALWGMVFLVPRLLPDFSPFLLSSGRYMMYGLVSLVAALPMARRLAAKLTREDFATLVKLALVGNIAYYILLSAAVLLVGVAPASLIVGVLPVTVTLVGRHDHGAVPLARLAWPLAMVVAGIVCINVDVFTGDPAHPVSHLDRAFGVLCALGALASWTWFAVGNARYLQRNAHFDGNEWSVLWGVVTGLLGALLWCATAAAGAGVVHAPAATERWQLFWTLNLALAIGASWLGNGLWNAAACSKASAAHAVGPDDRVRDALRAVLRLSVRPPDAAAARRRGNRAPFCRRIVVGTAARRRPAHRAASRRDRSGVGSLSF